MIKILLILLLSSTCLLNASASKFGLKTTKGEPLELLELKTKALVEGPYAEIQYIQTYKNPLNHTVETKFHFPRTDSSIFHKFEAVFQNQTIVGKIMEKQTAKRMYDWNVRRGNTVAYSERSQNAPDVMNIKVGNIPANETVEIIFSVIQPLETIINKFYELKLPVVLTERYTPGYHYYHHETPNIQTVDTKASLYKDWIIEIELKSNSPFAILSNPSHLLKPKLSEQPSGSNSKIYKAVWNETVIPNKDFVIYFGPEKLEKPETILATYPQDPNNHVLLFNFVPDLTTIEAKVAQDLLESNSDGVLRLKKMALEYDIEYAQAEFIFVIDRSGSMMGNRIVNLKKALAKFLHTIPKSSYFNIISFGSSYELYKQQSVLNSPQALGEALKWIDTIEANMGGTEILDSLKYITHHLKEVADVPKIVMILTDGDVFNPDEVINHISANANKMRFCTVGIGYGASEYLVRNMAKAGKCTSEFVQDHEDIGDKALYMVQAAISQYITDVRFDITCFNDQNKKVYSDKAELDLLLKDHAFSKWIYLENITNLKSCQATLAYYSSLKGKRVIEEMDIQRYELEEINNFWHKVAYDSKIKELEQTIKKDRYWNQENLKTQIVDLSIKYQILSDHTSFLAVLQENTVNPNEQAQQINIPNMKSADYSAKQAQEEKPAKIEEEGKSIDADITLPDDDTFAGANVGVDVQFAVDADVDVQVDTAQYGDYNINVETDVEVQVLAQVEVDYDVDISVGSYDYDGNDIVLNMNTNVEVTNLLAVNADEFCEGCDNVDLDIDVGAAVEVHVEVDLAQVEVSGGCTETDISVDIGVKADLDVEIDVSLNDDGSLDDADLTIGIDMLAKVDVEADVDARQTRIDQADELEVQIMKNVEVEYTENADDCTESNAVASVDTEVDLHVDFIKEQEEKEEVEVEDEDNKTNISAQNIDAIQTGWDCDATTKECSEEEKQETSSNRKTESSPDLKFVNTTNHTTHANLTKPVLTQVSDEKEFGNPEQNVNLTSKKSLGDNSNLTFTCVSLIIMILSMILF